MFVQFSLLRVNIPSKLLRPTFLVCNAAKYVLGVERLPTSPLADDDEKLAFFLFVP
jgi:hypothetical protein